MPWSLVKFGHLLSCILLASTSSSDDPACITGLETCLDSTGTVSEARSENEVEEEEEAETTMMEVKLLQTAVLTRPAAVSLQSREAELLSSKDRRDAVDSGTAAPVSNITDSIVSLDHNGHVCMLCGSPLPQRVGNRTYTKFRKDCGSQSSPTGPTAADLTLPAVQFARLGSSGELPMNGFCALNFAKSCADAVANEDYLYWPKSLDLASPHMSANAPWDARYCNLNGFLRNDIVTLQHNFTGMRDKARELCREKYSKYGIGKLTFVDMMSKSRYDDKGTPTQEEAELLAAWNCAMGDLGCDLAMCAYSFCSQEGGSIGTYDECAGWDPVAGMPF